MKTYRYQEQKLQTCRWVQQGYRDYPWQANVKEELDEGKYVADSDLEEPDAQRDSREGHSSPGESEAEKEMTSLIQMAKDEKAGVEVRTINEKWKVWAESYSRVLNKFAMLQDKYGEQEIQELFEEAEGNSETAASSAGTGPV
jgi:hypothetical protein